MKLPLNINLEEYIAKARGLGIEVNLNSDTPGTFTMVNGSKVELSHRNIFPELKILENKVIVNGMPKFAYTVEVVEVKIPSNKKSFQYSKKLIGAA